jgi:hypothetical protein
MSRLKARFNNKFNRIQTLEDLEVIRRILQDNPVRRGQSKATSPSTDQTAGTPSVNLPTSINQPETYNIPLSPECMQPLKKRKVESDPDVEPSDSEEEEAIDSVPSGDNNTAGTNTLVIPAVTNSEVAPGRAEVGTPTMILEGSEIEHPIQSESINQLMTIEREETIEQSINQSMAIELAELEEDTDVEGSRSQPCVNLPAHSSERLSISQPVLSSKGLAIDQPDQGFIKVHRERPKSNWRVLLKKSTKYLLITDDNLKLNEEVPAYWEAHIFPEAHLSNITNIINHLNDTSELVVLFLAVGWYDRERAENNMRKEINALAFACNKLNERDDVETRFIGITGRQDKPIPPGVAQLNTIAKQKFGAKCWKPVVENYVFTGVVPSLSTYVNLFSDMFEK